MAAVFGILIAADFVAHMNYGHSLCLARFVAPRIDSAVESHSWALHFGSASIVITTAFAICHCRLVDHGKRSFNSLRARFKSRSKRVANARARECSSCALRCLHMINLAFFACSVLYFSEINTWLGSHSHPPTHTLTHTVSHIHVHKLCQKHSQPPAVFMRFFLSISFFFASR